MLLSITVKNRAGQAVPLGAVTNPVFSQAMHANHGHSQLRALELDFYRNLGQNNDDPADDVFFELQAGQGHGEVVETEASVTFKNARTLADIGVLKMPATVRSYYEADLGESIRAHIVLRA